ncbi:RRXRR domain-containing protein [Microcoleus sp. herbarium2]
MGDRNLSQSWHRKARFLNRIRPQGWLAPSLQHRVDRMSSNW